MEIHQKIIDYVENRLDGLYAPIQAIPLGEGTDGIAITVAPSRHEKKFMDGSIYDTMMLQITTRSADSTLAMDTLCCINTVLEVAPAYAITSKDGEFQFDKCDINTNVHLAYMDKDQTYVYTSSVKVYFFRKIERGE